MTTLPSRLSTAILQNNEDAGYIVYNTTNHTINISDINNLSIYEKYAILISHTANVNFNSFAAEVEFHADLAILDVVGLTLEDMRNLLDLDFYNNALRADMAVETRYLIEAVAPYYYLNSTMVTQQANAHGEY